VAGCFDVPGDFTGYTTMNSMSIRIIVCLFAICAVCAAQEQSPVDKVTADYNQVRSQAIDKVNQKYIPLADAEMRLTLKDGDLQKANAINDWKKRLEVTDDKSNTAGIVPGAAATDRLAFLQAAYLKERSEEVTLVNKSYLAFAAATRQQAMKDGNLDVANAADKLLTKIKAELADAAPAPASTNPFGVRNGTSPGSNTTPVAPASPSPTAPPSQGVGASAFTPGVGFGSTTDTSRFAGTVWASTSHIGGSGGAIATLRFQPDGTWIETYKPHPMHGHWKPTPDTNVVEVDISNDSINGRNPIHFKMAVDGATCHRVEDGLAYAIKK
jgi:hypothetical protein